MCIVQYIGIYNYFDHGVFYILLFYTYNFFAIIYRKLHVLDIYDNL